MTPKAKCIAWTLSVFALCWGAAGVAIWHNNQNATVLFAPAYLRGEKNIESIIAEIPKGLRSEVIIESVWVGRSQQSRLLHESVAMIFREFDADSVRANAKYKGKRLFALGYVAQIRDDSVRLTFSETDSRGADCSLPANYDLTWLRVGDFVYADGELMGQTGSSLHIKCWRLFPPSHLEVLHAASKKLSQR